MQCNTILFGILRFFFESHIADKCYIAIPATKCRIYIVLFYWDLLVVYRILDLQVHANGLDVAPVYKLMKTSKSGMFLLIKRVNH